MFILYSYFYTSNHSAAASAKLLQSCPALYDPHRWQSPRICCPWDSLGKNTGVGCHFLLQCMQACWVASVVSDSVRTHGQQLTKVLCPRDSLGKNTGVGCHCLLWIVQLLICKTIAEISDGKLTVPFPGSVKGLQISNFFLPVCFHQLSLSSFWSPQKSLYQELPEISLLPAPNAKTTNRTNDTWLMFPSSHPRIAHLCFMHWVLRWAENPVPERNQT